MAGQPIRLDHPLPGLFSVLRGFGLVFGFSFVLVFGSGSVCGLLCGLLLGFIFKGVSQSSPAAAPS